MPRHHRITYLVSIAVLCFTLIPLQSSVGDTLTMDGAVSLGLERHPGIQSALGELDMARGDLLRIVSPESPVVTIENEHVPRRSSISHYGEQTMGIGQSLEFPVVTVFRARSAVRAVQSAKANVELAEATFRGEIRMAFVLAWLFDREAAITDSLAGTAGLLARNAVKKETAGIITSLERDRLAVQAQQSAREHDSARLRHRAAVARLEQLIGTRLEPGTVLARPELGKRSDPEYAGVEGKASLVRRAALSAESAESWLVAEKLAWLPRIEVKVFRQLTPDESFWGGELGFTLPVWYLLGERGDIQKARGQAERASADRESARREWKTRWTEASLSLGVALKTVSDFEEMTLPVSRRTLQAAIRSYEVGEIGITDLLSSFIQERTVELEYLKVVENAWHWRTQLDILMAGFQGR